MKNSFIPLKALLFSFLFSICFLISPAQAVPPPPPLSELCQNSDMIVLGKYVGGEVSEVKDCQFWVTFQVKPEKYYKKPAAFEDLKVIQFKKRYFVDDKKCSRIPGPNAMPGSMKESLKKPKNDKQIFFLKTKQGNLYDLTNVFWSIINWHTAARQWHDEFKATPACQATQSK